MQLQGFTGGGNRTNRHANAKTAPSMVQNAKFGANSTIFQRYWNRSNNLAIINHKVLITSCVFATILLRAFNCRCQHHSLRPICSGPKRFLNHKATKLLSRHQPTSLPINRSQTALERLGIISFFRLPIVRDTISFGTRTVVSLFAANDGEHKKRTVFKCCG